MDGLALSRRDPSLVRALPVLLWLRRGDLDMTRLRRLAARKGRERTLGFFLDLTARLSRDRGLRNAAAALGPARSLRATKFFTRCETALARAVAEERAPPVARAWGYRMNMPMDSFKTLFDKSRALHREKAARDQSSRP